MRFLDRLKRVLEDRHALSGINAKRPDPGAQSGVTLSPEAAAKSSSASTTDYDRELWRRKLRRAVELYPRTQAEFAILEADEKALDLDPDWALACKREEFAWAIRRIVADRVVTPSEHDRLDEIRELLNLSEEDAAAILHGVVSDAETVFDGNIEGV
jgi:hypothetical protein